MSIFSKLSAIYQAKVNELTTSLEDPKASLDYSLSKLEEIRVQMNRSLVEVSAARMRLADQRTRLAVAGQKHEDQARLALDAGREDLARSALERRQEVGTQLIGVQASLDNLDRQLVNLKESQANLEHKITLFQSKKEELKAIYDASKAQVQVREAVLGISGDLDDVGRTIQRAEERILELQSRSAAIDGLVSEGVLVEPLDWGRDDIDRELARISRQQAVDAELLRLKAESHPALEDPDHPAAEQG
jgi:phage shock protein A